MTTIIIDESHEMGKNLLNFLEKFKDEGFILIEKQPNTHLEDLKHLPKSSGLEQFIRRILH